ncbi:hypothetical protein NDU88_004571, partial [Pleurodeles waltl]
EPWSYLVPDIRARTAAEVRCKPHFLQQVGNSNCFERLLERLHSCHNTSFRTILLQKRHLLSQSQVVQHTEGHDDLAHLLWSTSGLYTGGCRHLLTCPSGRALWRRTASRGSANTE